ncbi:MAG: hypothetical protein ACK4NS_00245 [Saprospiraceae bacterium]
MKTLFFFSLTLLSLCLGPAALSQPSGQELEKQAHEAYEKGYTGNSPEAQAQSFDEAARLYEAAAKAYEKEKMNDKADKARKSAHGARQNAEHRRNRSRTASPQQQVVATGRTTGHIADLVLTNPGAKSADAVLPASVVIPSDGQYQGYAVPTTPGKTTVPPGQTRTVPLTGYCTHPDLPAPPPGTILPTPTDWPPTLLPTPQTVRTLETTARRLLDQGAIQLPLDEPAFIVQQTYWIFVSTPYNPCAYLNTLLTEAGVPQDAIPTAIAQVVDAMLTVGREAGLPEYQPALPALPIRPPAPPAPGAVKPTVRVTGTGQTTGHIADITIRNPSDQPIAVVVGNSAYIPSTGRYQAYVAPKLPPITVPPRETVTTPIHGYCADVRRPPVPAGNDMPPLSEWIASEPGADLLQLPNAVRIPTRAAPPLTEVANILQSQPVPPVAAQWDCLPLPPANTQPLLPGTDTPIRVPISAADNPGLAVPLLLDAISRLEDAYERLGGTLTTPFSNNPPREREAVIQQTFWIYSARLEGKPYTYNDFHDNTVKQFETNSGRPYNGLPPDQKEKLDKGVDDFWDAFTATGVEAKILPKTPETPKLEDVPPLKMPFEDPSVLIQNRPRQQRQRAKKCECGSVSFNLQIWAWGNDGSGNNVHKGAPYKEAVSGNAAPGQAAQAVPIKKNDLPARPANDDIYLIAIRNIKADCPCTEWTESIEQAIKGLEKAMRDNADKISRAREALDKAQKELDTLKSQLEKARAAKRPVQSTIDRLEIKMQKAEEKKEKAESDLATLENPIHAKKSELDDLKKAAKQSDCTVYTNEKNPDSKLPPQVKAKNTVIGRIENAPDGSKLAPEEYYYSFRHDPNKPLTYDIEISFYCEGDGCKPISCSRTFVVKVEE